MMVSTFELTRSERRVLGLLFRRGALTQSALADETELTQQSISRIVTRLSDEGMLRLSDKTAPGKRGYPSNVLELIPNYIYAVGIALMADAAAIALIDFAGQVRAERKQTFNTLSQVRVLEWARSAMAEVTTPDMRMAGCGISLAGSFIGTRPGFNTPHYLEEWADVSIEKIFTDAFQLPAWADNDGNAAALCESMIGVGRWAANFAYIYVGAGVGGGLVLNNEVWRGRFGNAGEFAGGLPPNIYPFPNLELLRQLVAKEGQHFQNVDEMLEHWNPEWNAITDWTMRVRDSLSIIASNATAILDLEAIVLGGRMPRSLAERIIPMIELYDQRRRAVSRPMAKIVPAEAEGNPAAIGAAMLPLKNTFFA
jgi:predicted NBD/HSP70 family sugar kinase